MIQYVPKATYGTCPYCGKQHMVTDQDEQCAIEGVQDRINMVNSARTDPKQKTLGGFE